MSDESKVPTRERLESRFSLLRGLMPRSPIVLNLQDDANALLDEVERLRQEIERIGGWLPDAGGSNKVQAVADMARENTKLRAEVERLRVAKKLSDDAERMLRRCFPPRKGEGHIVDAALVVEHTIKKLRARVAEGLAALEEDVGSLDVAPISRAVGILSDD